MTAPDARGAIAGRVVLAAAHPRPAAGATIVIGDATGEVRRIETDAQGRFRVEGLVAGTYVINAVGTEGAQADLRIDVSPGATAEATLQLTSAIASETGETPGEMPGETIDVHGQSEATRRQQSADAVTVVDTERAKRETADLGEVLARTQGVNVRRAGGLGSGAQLSLAGLTGDQIRLFLDGIPLPLAGFPFGIANVPVNLIDRIEVYSGVVPIRFGGDALGGGINLVTDRVVPGAHGGASLEVGSFGTERVTLDGQYLDRASGLYGRIDGFVDRARNDYRVSVEVPDAQGGLVPATLPLSHDHYAAGGGAVEVGATDRPWARRLMLRGFASGYDKQVPSDPGMDRAYGGVTSGERSVGAHSRYEQAIGPVAVDAVAGYVFTRGTFRDVSTCQYDWYGRCFLMNQPGEIDDNKPRDQVTWDHSGFARAAVSWPIAPGHTIALSSAPTYAMRSGHERLDAGLTRDPLSGHRTLFTVVSGLEYQIDLLGDRLENIAFVKHYAQWLGSADPLPGGAFSHTDRDTQRPGAGDGLRYRFAGWLYAKASYEWATRLPRPVEAFGDNAFIRANPAIEPESSHNLNLGLTVDDLRTPAGAFTATATGFLRQAKNLITLFGTDPQSYQNVFGARVIGADAAAVWTSPGELVSLDGSATYQDLRNDSSEGAFGSFHGVRIPNRPYLFGAASARLTLRDLARAGDQLVISAGSRYVHSFYRSWENVGLADSKQVIPSQLVHSVGVGYLMRGDRVTVSTTVEVSNLTDEAVFDFYGLQRPGRAISVKTALDF